MENPRNTPVTVFSTEGGIVNRRRPWALRDNEVADNYGWDQTLDGHRRKRHGVRPLYSKDTAEVGLGLGFFQGAQRYAYTGPTTDVQVLPPYDVIVAIYDDGEGRSSGPSIRVIEGDGSENAPTLTFQTEILSGLEYHLFNGAGRATGFNVIWPVTFIVNAHEHPTDPTLAADLNYLANVGSSWRVERVTGVKPRAGCFLQGRLWIGNLQNLETGVSQVSVQGGDGTIRADSLILPGDLYDPKSFSAKGLLVEPFMGGSIVGMYPLRQERPAMIVFKQSAIVLVEPRWGTNSSFVGVHDDAIDTIETRIRTLSQNLGCASQRSVAEVQTRSGSDLWFLGSDGHVHSVARVEQDVISGASDAITWDHRETMRRVNLEFGFKAVATVWDDKYFLSVPLDNNSTNTHTLVLDTKRGTLLAIEPLGFTNMITGTGQVGGQTRTHLLGMYATETADCSFTGARTGYHIFQLYHEDQNIDPGGAAIQAREETAAFHHGRIDRKKKWQYLAVQCETDSSVTASVSVDYSRDGQAFTSLGTLTFAPASSGSRLTEQRLPLVDVEPSYTIQYRLTSADTARPAILYVQNVAQLIQDETDNSVR